jgi:hypothetical protein
MWVLMASESRQQHSTKARTSRSASLHSQDNGSCCAVHDECAQLSWCSCASIFATCHAPTKAIASSMTVGACQSVLNGSRPRAARLSLHLCTLR